MNLETIVAGDTLDFTIEVNDYPPSGGWTLKYRLTPRFTTPTQAPITLTATTSGETYLVQAAPATTAGWAAGQYAWARWVEKVGARQTLDESGELDVRPDPSASAQGYDGRSQAEKAYNDALTAYAVATAPGSTVLSYTIGTRQLTYRNQDEAKASLLQQISFWERQLANENDLARMAKGLANPRLIGMRISRV